MIDQSFQTRAHYSPHLFMYLGEIQCYVSPKFALLSLCKYEDPLMIIRPLHSVRIAPCIF